MLSLPVCKKVMSASAGSAARRISTSIPGKMEVLRNRLLGLHQSCVPVLPLSTLSLPRTLGSEGSGVPTGELTQPGCFSPQVFGPHYPVAAAEKNVAGCQSVRAVGLPAGELHDRELLHDTELLHGFARLCPIEDPTQEWHIIPSRVEEVERLDAPTPWKNKKH